jgi:hypothetical protein
MSTVAENTKPNPPAVAGQLVRPERTNVTALASASPIRTPLELADRMREMQEVSHLLSPAASVAMIPSHIVINPVVVVIDPAVDADTGRGTDVYYQASIHKKVKRNNDWCPLEVSLNAKAIVRLLRAAGVNITRSARTDDGTKPHYWAWTSEGKLRDFDGSWLVLPPGDVEIDLSDGSAQVGEWTQVEWAKREAAAEVLRAKKPEGERWKVKAETIGGWSGERVMGARKFGLRLAQAKSLSALGRNLGIKQIYSIAELEKPFVIFRASFVPDMTNQRVVEMVTAHELGAMHLMFPGGSPVALPPGAEPAAIGGVGQIVDLDEPEVSTAGTPAGAAEVQDIPAKVAEQPADVFLVTKVSLLENRYYFETKQGKTFVTADVDTARTLNAARKAEMPMVVDGEPVTIEGKPFLQVINAVPFKAASLPRPEDL